MSVNSPFLKSSLNLEHWPSWMELLFSSISSCFLTLQQALRIPSPWVLFINCLYFAVGTSHPVGNTLILRLELLRHFFFCLLNYPKCDSIPGIPSSAGYLSIKSLKILELGSKLSIILDLYCFALLSILLKFGLVFLSVFLLPFYLETVLIWWPLTNLVLILHCFHLLKPSGICLYSVSASLACLSLWLYFVITWEYIFKNILSVNTTSYPILFSILFSLFRPHNELLVYLLPWVLLSFSYALYVLFVWFICSKVQLVL